MAITIGNLLLAATTVLSAHDFEADKLGSPGLARSWGSGDHNVFVTNVKAHDGEKGVCVLTGGTAGQQAISYEIFNADRDKEHASVLESGYLRFSYWFCPETSNAAFTTELRTNTSRNLIWRTAADGFWMNAGWLSKEARKLPDWRAKKGCELGKWHKVEIFIPVSFEERLNAKIRITWPDGSVETGETDYDHRKDTKAFTWMPILDPWVTNSRFFLDSPETAAVGKEEAPKSSQQ